MDKMQYIAVGLVVLGAVLFLVRKLQRRIKGLYGQGPYGDDGCSCCSMKDKCDAKSKK